MFSEFFDDPEGFFFKQWNKFNRPVLDQQPYSVYKTPGKGYIVVCNTLGMNKEDVSVNIEKQKGTPYSILRVKGDTTIDKINFHNTVDLAITLRFTEKIEDVSYEVKNGLTIVYLKMKLEEEPKLSAKYIDDGSLDW